MTARLDHVVVGVADLATARAELARSGLEFVPGGRHPAGTHNALLVSPDHWSYVELIAPGPNAGGETDVGSQVRRGGLVAYAFSVDDIDHTVLALAEQGFPCTGVTAGSRRTTQGRLIQWWSAVLHPGFGCSELPFLIQWADSGPDRTGVPAVASAYLTKLDVGTSDPGRLATLLKTLGLDVGEFDDGVAGYDGQVEVRFAPGEPRLRRVHLRRTDGQPMILTDRPGNRVLEVAVDGRVTAIRNSLPAPNQSVVGEVR